MGRGEGGGGEFTPTLLNYFHAQQQQLPSCRPASDLSGTLVLSLYMYKNFSFSIYPSECTSNELRN